MFDAGRPLTAVAVGFMLGARHAADVDHVVAISAVVRDGRGMTAALRRVAMWAVGHAVTFLTLGFAIVVFGMRAPHGFERVMEIAVGSMVVLLGAQQLRVRADAPAAAPVAQPLAVGLVHGLAGSNAVALLALSTIGSRASAAFYIVFFALGTTLGMLLLTALLAKPLDWAADRPRVHRLVMRVAGVTALLVGAFIVATAVFWHSESP